MDQYGRIDFLFNNAGAAIGVEFKDMKMENWHKMMDVNFWRIIYACIGGYPIMIKHCTGHIVNVSSFAGLMPGLVRARMGPNEKERERERAHHSLCSCQINS